MDRIAYKYIRRDQGYNYNPSSIKEMTIAVEVPTFAALKTAAMLAFVSPTSENLTLNVKVGVATLSEDDVFNKKIGRMLASSRLKDCTYKIISVARREVYNKEGKSLPIILIAGSVIKNDTEDKIFFNFRLNLYNEKVFI